MQVTIITAGDADGRFTVSCTAELYRIEVGTIDWGGTVDGLITVT